MRGSGVAAERARLRRRRVVVLSLTLAAAVIQFATHDQRPAALAKAPPPVVRESVTPSLPATTAPSPAASPVASAAPAAPSVSPLPSPKGPPFVLDAAPSCAGKTALIDLQVAATAARPIAALELYLDGGAASLTPVPSGPMTSYAGRSSGIAAPGGSGQWMLRAVDADGIADTRVYPYACG